MRVYRRNAEQWYKCAYDATYEREVDHELFRLETEALEGWWLESTKIEETLAEYAVEIADEAEVCRLDEQVRWMEH
jgi:hypothetical protein